MTHVTVTPEMPRVNLCRGAETPNIVLPAEEDLIFEEKLLHSPYDVKLWLAYSIFKENCACFNTTASFRTSCSRSPRQLQGEILCHIFPEITYSFYVLLEQLWYSYLNERCAAVRPKHIASKAYDALGSVFERALVTMHKMPRIWELYLNMLAAQRVITKVRHTCDRALAALPVTQHGRMWKIYLVSP